MLMTSLFEKFPGIAQKETRSITLIDDSNGVEEGKYTFLEFFCSDKKCDCRRVMVQVVNPTGHHMATLSYGWENLDFYLKWTYGHEESAHAMVGAQLYDFSPQTKHSLIFLEFFRALLRDSLYAARIQQHYHLFKSGHPSQLRKPIMRNKYFQKNSASKILGLN